MIAFRNSDAPELYTEPSEDNDYRRVGQFVTVPSAGTARAIVYSSTRRPTASDIDRMVTSWRQATAHHSNPGVIVRDPACMPLMRLDPRELVTRLVAFPRLVYVLEEMTRKRPYDGIESGDMKAMAAKWVEFFSARPSHENAA